MESKSKAKRKKKPATPKSPKIAKITNEANVVPESDEEIEEEDVESLAMLKSNLYEAKNIFVTAVDEVALEGLDGITIEGLWKRIAIALNYSTCLSSKLENVIWNYLMSVEDISCFELPTPRPKLVINNRYKAEDPSCLQHNTVDIYPFVSIHDKVNGIIGSCSTYFDRVNITDVVKKLSLAESSNTYGNKLVLVASTDFRADALRFDLSPPILDLSDIQYQLMERIGRSRKEGELTYGENSLVRMGIKDAKTLFYFRKLLHKHNLILKQYCYTKQKEGGAIKGCILHLPRFYNEIKNKRHIIMEQIVRLLKSKPDNRMEIDELKKRLGKYWFEMNIRSLTKMNEFKTIVNRRSIKYREMYPDAQPSEWKKLATPEERTIRVFELANSNVNLKSLWKEDDSSEDTSDDEEVGSYCYNVSLLHDVYECIRKTGRSGVSTAELQRRKCIDFYTLRGLLGTLVKKKLLTLEKMDAGRIRYTLYVASCFADEEVYKKFLEEEKNQDAKHDNEEDSDDEACDFVAGVLGVESKHVKKKPRLEMIEIVEENQFKGKYEQLRELRRKKNKKPDDANSDERQQIIELFTNKEDFIRPEASRNLGILKPNPISVDLSEDFKQVMCGLFAPKNTSVVSDTLYGDKVKADESKIDVKLVEELKKRRSATKSNFKMGKKHFQMFLNVFPKLSVSYQLYINRNKAIIESLKADVEAKKELPNSFVSSDEEDIEEEDANSLDGNQEDGDVIKNVRARDEDYQKEIIESFENVDSIKFEDECKIENENDVAAMELEEKVENEKEKEKLSMYGVKYEKFFGPKPEVRVIENDKDDIDIVYVISTDPKDFGRDSSPHRQRVKSRMNYVKQVVQKHQVITDLHNIQYGLQAKEKEEGYKSLVDRQSLHRIYEYLVADGSIKALKIIARCKGIVRCRTTLCWSTVNVDEHLALNLDAFKISVFLYSRRKNIQRNTQAKDMFKLCRTIGIVYGYSPKVIKMKLLHELLFYVTRDYNGAKLEDVEKESLLTTHGHHEIDELLNDCSSMYQQQINWKTFVGPLPTYKDYPKGWVLISDLIFRMPISTFVRIVKVGYIIPDLEKKFLNHPIRKNYLIKELPSDIKDALMKNRRYVYVIFDILNLLCFMGLLQFGTQKFKEKDQVFVYVNQNAILYDTTSSDPGYHHVSQKEYPMNRYHFRCMDDITKYWNDMNVISMSSKLGMKTLANESSLHLENINFKPILMEHLKPQTVKSAAERDVGYLPGDGLGACCVDSCFWLHMKRNWTYVIRSEPQPEKKPRVGEVRKRYMDNIKPVKFGDFIKERKKVQQSPEMLSTEAAKKLKLKKKIKLRMKMRKAAAAAKLKRKMGIKRNGTDSVDKMILQKTGLSRSRYSEEEDTLLKICWDAINYLCPSLRKRNVNNTTIRDFMHRILPYSRKTSAAYRRRILVIKANETNKKMNFIDLHSDAFTQKHFFRVREKLDARQVTESEMNLTFLHLAYCTYKNWMCMEKVAPGFVNVKDFLQSDYFEKFNEKNPAIYKDPACTDDVILDTLKAVIHSALSVTNPPSDWPLELLQIYQTFSDATLRRALMELRNQQLVSCTKGRIVDTSRNTAVICGNIYHLSFGYLFKQITKYPDSIFAEVHELMMSYYNEGESMRTEPKSVKDYEHGHGLALIELATVKTFTFNFDLSEEIITLDPTIKDHQKLVQWFAQRYKMMLEKDPNDVPENNDALQKKLEDFLKMSKGEVENKDEDNIIMVDRRLKISELTFLMTRGLFPELDDDDELDKLNKHYVTKYPDCSYTVDEPVSHDDIYKTCYVDIVENSSKFLEEIRKQYLTKTFPASIEEVYRTLEPFGINESSTDSLINFIKSKKGLGATSKELKAEFEEFDLESALKSLRRLGVILRVGIQNFHFVHYVHANSWSIVQSKPNGRNFDQRVAICPWIKIDGNYNVSVLCNWLGIVITHCMSYPYQNFRKICSKFCYIKPVDIYQLIEILKHFNCLEIKVYYSNPKCSLFSDFDFIEEGIANMMDDFDDIFIVTDHLAAMKFGTFLSNLPKDDDATTSS